MKKITIILFGVVCFIVGAITTIMIFLKTLLDIEFIRDVLIVGLKKVITDKVKYQKYSDYYKNPEYKSKNHVTYHILLINSKMDFIKSKKYQTYDKAEEVVKDIKRYIQEFGKCTVNDILDLINEEDRQWYKGDDYGYDSRHFYSIGVNPNGSYGNWTIKFDNFPVLLSR